MESIAGSLNRQLSRSHPVYKLLKPHFLHLNAINPNTMSKLFSDAYDPGPSSGSILGARHLVLKSLAIWRLDVHATLPEYLKSRQVLDETVLAGAYHARDDGLLLYNAIEAYVSKYVRLYYGSHFQYAIDKDTGNEYVRLYCAKEGSLMADNEIQSWGAEMVRSKEEGGAGILGVPNNGKFEKVEDLIRTITPIIYTCSVAHAQVNAPNFNELGAPFNYSWIMYGTPPKNKDPRTIDDVLKSIGNRFDVLLTLMNIKVGGQKPTLPLGYYGKEYIVDPPAKKILEEFQQELRDIQKTIDDRNSKREFPYEYVRPESIHNNIFI